MKLPGRPANICTLELADHVLPGAVVPGKWVTLITHSRCPACWLLGISLAGIFAAETAVMLLLNVLPPIGGLLTAALDAGALVLLVFPVLYALMFRPLVYHVAELRQAERKQQELIGQLQKALADVKTLSGMLPICASCKKIRSDDGHWEQIDKFVLSHSEVEFTHGVCPECVTKLYPSFMV